MTRLPILKPKRVKYLVGKITLALGNITVAIWDKLKPAISFLWRNRIVALSYLNTVVSGALAMVLVLKLVNILQGNRYWRSMAEQSGIVNDSGLSRILSIAQNNLLVMLVLLVVVAFILSQTLKILTRAKKEKWDIRARGKLVKQLSVLTYLVILFALAVVILR